MSARLKTAPYLPNHGPFGDARTLAGLARENSSGITWAKRPTRAPAAGCWIRAISPGQ